MGDVALHVEEARGVSSATVALVLEQLAVNIEAQSGARVARHGADWGSCISGRPACRGVGLARNRGGEVVALVLVGGITKLRVVMQLFAGGAVSEFAIDLPKRTGEWGPILRGVAEKMFPKVRGLPGLAASEPASEPGAGLGE